MHDDFLFCDLETFSPVPIKHGTHRYAEGAEVLLWTYAVGDGPVGCWDPTADEPMPAELRDNLADPERMTCWHNGGMFDEVVLPHALGIDIPLERTHDTLVQALSHSLPGALGTLCEILNVPTADAKDKEGRAIIRLFCMPQADGSRATRLTHPQQWAKFKTYAGADILAMRQVYKRVPMWNYKGFERELWQLDQKINRRGMCIDVDLANAAVAAVAQAQKSLAARTVEMTDGEVQTATQRDAMLVHILAAYGVDLPDMQKATIERRVQDPDLPIALRELLAVRLQASTSSTAKYTALIKGTSSDGRLRGTKQFNGAMRTGRWAGRLFQPDNLPRPSLPQDEIDFGIEALKAGCADLLYSNVMKLTSSAIRGCIVAPKGKKLVVADLSNIEGRDQAWLAGEHWKLQAFRDFDAGNGPDLYKLAYSKSFGIKPADVTKDQRQVGKVQELALGYEGGVGAFVTFAAAYNIDLETLPAKVLDVAAPDLVKEARDFLAWTIKQKRATFGLSDDAFVACDTLKRAWRRAHPNIVSLWSDLKTVVTMAIESPGKTFTLRTLKIRRDGAWLRIVLPSGRALCYPSPQLDGDTITYMGVNQYSRKWSRLKTYGGKLFENICQAVARDVMAANMPAIESWRPIMSSWRDENTGELYEAPAMWQGFDKDGFQIVLTVHDEVITEAPDTDEYSSDRLSALLAANPAWALDMPLAAAGFETPRYKKD